MKRILFALLIFTFIPSLSFSKDTLKPVKNIIIMISDGCGCNCFDAASLYQFGEYEGQIYDSFPVKLHSATTLAKSKGKSGKLEFVTPYSTLDTWSNFEYCKDKIPCSAASATEIATGVKTYKGAVGVDLDKLPVKNLTELAAEKGKSAGIVTSVPWNDGTPAGFTVHNTSRSNYFEISKSMLTDTKLNVIMGCCHPYYDADGKKLDTVNGYESSMDLKIWNDIIQNKSMIDGKVVQDIDNDGKPDAWTFIESKSDFDKMVSTNTPPKRLLGVPQVKSTLQLARSLPEFYYLDGKMQIPEEDPDSLLRTQTPSLPSLDTMSLAALNVLNQNPNGFFAMIEGGAVDWAAHNNQEGRMIAEQICFNRTVETVVEWIETNSSWDETLLIVTSDHETGYITAPGQDKDITTWNKLPKTKKGELPKIQWNSKNHTNNLVPFYAKGNSSEYFYLFADDTDIRYGKYIETPEIAQLIFMLWSDLYQQFK